jgi:DNA-binding transcriptional MerR regulator
MFRIGEFSKIAQVSISQLRYYDEINLLKPARIDKWTGYRYYSARQLPYLNRILALKDLGLSLDQIRRMLHDEVSSEEIRGMFALRRAQAEQTVHEELTRLRQIESRLRQIEDEGRLDGYDIVVKSVPAQPYLALRETVPSVAIAFAIMMELVRTLPEKVGSKHLGYLTVIIHNDTFVVEHIDVEMGFVTTESLTGSYTLSDGRTMTLDVLPAVETMVTTVQIGRPDMAHASRAALATWVELNGYKFAGNGREVFIVLPYPGQEQETVMEIQYPIERVDPVLLLLT